MISKKIKELFDQLSVAEQVQLLKDLSSGSKTSMSISEFAVGHQARYGTDISFQITQTGQGHIPTITAVLHTEFGQFTGRGENQKLAKAQAVQKAVDFWNENS